MKSCTPLWREARLQVKMYKNTPRPDHFWKMGCRKGACGCGAKHISKSKCTKHLSFGALLEVALSKKCTPLWREARFEVKMLKTPPARTRFDVQISFCVAGEGDYAPCQKLAKLEGFVASPKTMAGVGHLKRICKDAFSVAGAVQETCSSELLGGAGDGFLRGCILEHQIFRFAEMILCDRRNTPGITFSWQTQYFRQVEWKNCKTHWYEAVSSALNFPFLKEVSQNCFVFDVVNFKK